MSNKTQKSALISVFNKEGIEKIAQKLKELDIRIISTGGTEKYLTSLNFDVLKVENLTSYPSIFGGRVKTLHPSIFGGILYRRENESDIIEQKNYDIPSIDYVIVDLYPFEETVLNASSHEDIIEKIDIGGISLIRAAAKNYKDVVCVSSIDQYEDFLSDLDDSQGNFSIEKKQNYASHAFKISSNYDSLINEYLVSGSISETKQLRYGENPHQKGFFKGSLESVFEKFTEKNFHTTIC